MGAHQGSAPHQAGMDHQVACTLMLLRTATRACPAPPAVMARTDTVCRTRLCVGPLGTLIKVALRDRHIRAHRAQVLIGGLE